MNKTKVAVVGLGGIAQVMHLPSLLKLKEVEISAVCDTEIAKAKNISVKYGIKKYYKEIDDMLKECPDLDAVVISAQTNAHKELAIKCLDAGKDVLVEKPLGRDYKEALAIVEAADRNKRQLMVGMNNRFRNDVMMQRSFVRGNETGDVFYVKTGWLKTQSSTQKWFVDRDKSGGGVFLDNGIVMLDIGLWMLGFPEVHSVTSINYSHNTTSVEDSNFTFVKFKNNASLTIEVSWSLLRVQEFFYVNVYGKKGSTSINPLRILKKVDNNLLDMTPKNVKTPLNIEKTGYENEMRHFIGAIRGTHKLLSTGKEALEVMQIVEGVYKSAKSGKEVIF